jgi:hypothetical protein
MNAIEQISSQEEVSAIPEGIRELINWKVRSTDFLHQIFKDITEDVSRPEKFFSKTNIFSLIRK